MILARAVSAACGLVSPTRMPFLRTRMGIFMTNASVLVNPIGDPNFNTVEIFWGTAAVCQLALA